MKHGEIRLKPLFRAEHFRWWLRTRAPFAARSFANAPPVHPTGAVVNRFRRLFEAERDQ